MQLGDHALVELHRDDLFGALQQLHGQVSRARANLQHNVRGLDLRLGKDISLGQWPCERVRE